MPFVRDVRLYILWRDSHKCTNCGKRFHDGWNLQAAHYPEFHKNGWDNDPNHGRALCTECHLVEEISRGNINGAELLFYSQTFRTHSFIRRTGGIVIPKPSKTLIRELRQNYRNVFILKNGKKNTFAVIGDERPQWEDLVKEHLPP
jgi:hypothetical protein